MRIEKRMLALVTAMGIVLGAACDRNESGADDDRDTLDIAIPEDAGERLEEAGRDVGEAVGEGLEAAGGAIQEAGQEVQEEMREGMAGDTTEPDTTAM